MLVLLAEQLNNASNGHQQHHSNNSGTHSSGNDTTGMRISVLGVGRIFEFSVYLNE